MVSLLDSFSKGSGSWFYGNKNWGWGAKVVNLEWWFQKSMIVCCVGISGVAARIDMGNTGTYYLVFNLFVWKTKCWFIKDGITLHKELFTGKVIHLIITSVNFCA